MERNINGFHQDDEGHWVAELECGHGQHVRHDPPWENRPWVLTPDGRANRLGVRLNCVKCDHGLPPDRTVPSFNDTDNDSEASMSTPFDSVKPNDPYQLSRFLRAQQDDYDQALSEIRAGDKRSHWMWYIFPQLDGLAVSSTSKYYAIKSIDEARAYLAHPVLGPRLLECADAVVRVQGRSAADIFGFPDDVKLKSCATLFASVSPPGSVFERLLDKYYDGKRDGKTLRLLGIDPKTV